MSENVEVVETTEQRRARVTADAILRIHKSGIREHLCRGTMKKAREWAEALAARRPTSTTLRIVRGRAEKVLIDIPVEDVNEASAIWSDYRDAKGFGASTAPRALILVDGIQRGYVSFNGKVWKGHPTQPHSSANLIFDPYAEQPA